MTAIDHPRYVIKETLGEGSQGRVVRVIDRERPSVPLVAKILHESARRASNLSTEKHLKGELALLSRVRAPGLVRVHDLARVGGALLLVEDFVDGEDPISYVAEDSASASGSRMERLVAIAAHLARTLAVLHEAGFVHGDVKPDNIRVPASGAAMLLDLGAAISLDGIHTPAFAAPEIRAGAVASPASDMFALGATLWAVCTSSPSLRTGQLRDREPWVTPHVADLIHTLLAEHPSDRPTPRAVLQSLAGSVVKNGDSAVSVRRDARRSSTYLREDDVLRVLEAASKKSSVTYVTGVSGAGKSHLLREVMTRVQLEERDARLLCWPDVSATTTTAVINYLRGVAPRPFTSSSSASSSLLLLDDLHEAPVEVVEALESFRCQRQRRGDDVVVAASRAAPHHLATSSHGISSHVIDLRPLEPRAFDEILSGVAANERDELVRQAAGLPGWLFAALGRVPLTREAALGRVSTLTEAARTVLGLVAIFGGSAPHALFEHTDEREAIAECFEAGLLTRVKNVQTPERVATPSSASLNNSSVLRLASTHLAPDLADALASYALSDEATARALSRSSSSSSSPSDAGTLLKASALASILRSPFPPSARTELLVETARRAREEESRAIEIEALLALAADPKERTTERIVRLERLTRDAGRARSHPQVLQWLTDLADATAKDDASIACLAARRRAEERARAGDMDEARACADRALELANATLDRAYAEATRGSIALWSAEWANAADHFARARDALALNGDASSSTTSAGVDKEEVTRLEHNLGVVELYRGHAAEAVVAFERSTKIKRALGDRVGVRACLLNLGLALMRLEKWDEAEASLAEATSLAESLEEALGRGWCLAARADLEVRRKRPRDAERHVAEAEAMGDVVPKTVRADLVILRAQIALLEGDGRAALDSLGRVDVDVRKDDALVDARVLALEARAHLSVLPADRRTAARRAIASIRRAREGDLPEAIQDGQEALRTARGSLARPNTIAPSNAIAPSNVMTTSKPTRTNESTTNESDTNEGRDHDRDEKLWAVLRAIASASVPIDESMLQLTSLFVSEARAERAIVVAERAGEGDGDAAWGADLDNLPIADARKRVDQETLQAARRSDGVLYQSEMTTTAGTGSRLAIGGESVVIVIEHRFRAHAFDHVTEAMCKKWMTIAELAIRVRTAAATVASAGTNASSSSSWSSLQEPPLLQVSDHASSHFGGALHVSTAMPRREALREYPTILGQSVSLRRALAQLEAATDVDLPVLVEGETGTGKEVFARAMHDHGPRRSKPFVAVNCAAIADSLFEAELFGHARGAFTGADRARGGLLARAEGGTLLLDEMGDLALARQATLLRALEERRYRPVGSDDDRPFDVRIIAATNRDLDHEVEAGRFRKDLLYRLRVLRVLVPPLRDRDGDVELLLRHFLSRAGSRAQITPSALRALDAYGFPGNVRELSHLAQRLAASHLQKIDLANLPREIRSMQATAAAAAAATAPATPAEEVREVEDALARTGGNISHAANLLGLTRHGLKKRMLRLGLRAKREVGG